MILSHISFRRINNVSQNYRRHEIDIFKSNFRRIEYIIFYEKRYFSMCKLQINCNYVMKDFYS